MTTRELMLTEWQFDGAAVIVSVCALMAYAYATRLRDRTRASLFVAGIAVLLFSLVSPLRVLADGYLFCAHMTQHLLLILVAPALLLLGLPTVRGAGSAPRYAPLAWIAGVGGMWLWHAPTLCDAASHWSAVRDVQEISLVAMGTLFWLPVLHPVASRRSEPLAGMVYLFSACIGCTLLGVWITFEPARICSVFAHPVDRMGIVPLIRNGWGVSASADQQLGGLIMWVPACMVYLTGVLGLFARWHGAENAQRGDA